jgi:ATP-dependent DNA helicase RecG
VPNASVMVIEHADRFGLSQLHQLRGRVGRGDVQSYCILIGDPHTEDSMKRLNIMASTQDGFKISEEDLAIRGPGEFMGVRQHGLPEFKIANIIRDKAIMEISRDAAVSIISGVCDINHS